MPPAELQPPPLNRPSVGLVGSGSARPLARAFAAAGLRVTEFAFDGRCGTPHSFVADDSLAVFDALVIDVPATLTRARGADTTELAAAARVIGERLRRGQLVVLSGPVPPGTSRTLVLPLLAAAGAVPGRDFALAYATDAGPSVGRRIIGGFDPASVEAAAGLFDRLGPVARVSSLETAEVCGTVGAARAVQAAAANELTVACAGMGVDAVEVCEAGGLAPASTVDDPNPLLLAWGARRRGASFRLLELAVEINAGTAAHAVARVCDALNDAGRAVRGSQIAALGITSGRDRDAPDSRPGVELTGMLERKGAVVRYHDPDLPGPPRMQPRSDDESNAPVALDADFLAEQDCVLLAAAHAVYDYALIVRSSRLVIDTCRATRNVGGGTGRVIRV